jgi:hypothetical protein
MAKPSNPWKVVSETNYKNADGLLVHTLPAVFVAGFVFVLAKAFLRFLLQSNVTSGYQPFAGSPMFTALAIKGGVVASFWKIKIK